METISSEPQILAELHAAGVQVDSLSELRHSSRALAPAAPVLIRWARSLPSGSLRQECLWALGEKWAYPVLDDLIDLFASIDGDAPDRARWFVADAISRLAKPSDAPKVLPLITDHRFGRDRGAIIADMHRLRLESEQLVPLVRGFLQDPIVAGYAVFVVKRLRVSELAPDVAKLAAETESDGIRRSAKETLKRLSQASS